MRIYIAAKYTDKDPILIHGNIGEALDAAFEVALKGHWPYLPHWDYMMAIRAKKQLPLKWYYEYSMVWLKVCDAILILNGLEDSKGVQAEHRYALKTSLPIYNSIEEIPDK